MSDTPSRPSKALALVLAALCGIGVGHFYVGLRRRAIGWLLLGNALVLGGACLVVLLGRTRSFGVAFGLLLGLVLVAWAAPLADLAALPSERFESTSVLQLLGFFVASLVLSVAARTAARGWVIEAFNVPSGAMAPALLVGDHIFVDKLRYRGGAPARGEIAVFVHPEHPEQDFVKRIVGLPGDRIEVQAGHLVLNGHEVPRCSLGKATLPVDPKSAASGGELELERLDGHDYLVFHDDAAGAPSGQPSGPWVVKPGEVFVMGDNRENSADSRVWFGGMGGGVPFASLKGRALGIWMRLAGDDVDWSRMGATLTEPVLPASLASLQPALDTCRRELGR